MASQPQPEVRIVTVRPRTVISVIGLTVLVLAVLLLAYLAWQVLTWILIAMFLAVALNPAVEFFVRRGVRRPLAATFVFFLTLMTVVGIGFLFIPPLISQIQDFVEAVPDFIDDLTAGRGPLGFLQDDYQIVDRIRDAIEKQGVGGVLGLSLPVLDIVRSVVTAVVGVITIVFLTYFMLLDGPRTVDRFLALLPDTTRPRWERVGDELYRTVSGYVTGNLLISFFAAVFTTIVLFAIGSSYAIALAVVVAIIVFIETDWVRCLIVVAAFIAYQQFENHVLQPLVYGRTVKLSPLAVLCAVLIGAQLAGILGALLAIPVAASLLAIGRELLEYRKELADAGEPEPEL
jgi:predicted PurR-regulated permease PerM